MKKEYITSMKKIEYTTLKDPNTIIIKNANTDHYTLELLRTYPGVSWASKMPETGEINILLEKSIDPNLVKYAIQNDDIILQKNCPYRIRFTNLGGQANKTASVQFIEMIRDDSYVLRSFKRYKLKNKESFKKALNKVIMKAKKDFKERLEIKADFITKPY